MIVTNSNVVIIEKIGFLLVLFSQFCQVLLEQSRSRWLQKETNQTGNELLDIFQGEKGNKVDFPLQAFEVRAYICHQLHLLAVQIGIGIVDRTALHNIIRGLFIFQAKKNLVWEG